MARSVFEIQADIIKTNSDILATKDKIAAYKKKLDEFEEEKTELKAQLSSIDTTYDELNTLKTTLHEKCEALNDYACSFAKEFSSYCTNDAIDDELRLALLTCKTAYSRINTRIGVLNVQMEVYEDKLWTAGKTLELLNTRFGELCYERTMAQISPL